MSTCDIRRANVGVQLTGYTKIQKNNESELTAAIATVGPISVSIDSSQRGFQHYGTGIYSDVNCSSKDLDHAVTVVGYGTQDGLDYYIVKNSYGKSWGHRGKIINNSFSLEKNRK